MKRRVLYFKKDVGTIIQGIAGTSTAYIAIGQPCSAAGITGGGIVADMTLENGMIAIRKNDKDGKPMRDFGTVDIAGKKVKLECDGVMVPASKTNGLLFRDEPDDIDVAKPAQPPVQQGQRR